MINQAQRAKVYDFEGIPTAYLNQIEMVNKAWGSEYMVMEDNIIDKEDIENLIDDMLFLRNLESLNNIMGVCF